MIGERAEDRSVLRIAGTDAHSFLQGLVTRDAGDELTYSALLTPQGKYLADFFLLDRGDDLLLDVKTDIVAAVAQRLSMYRLRADVVIEEARLSVIRGLGDAPDGGFADPRDTSLGWRAYGMEGGDPVTDWDAIRVAACVPETGIELTPNDTYILEAGFDRLSGVDHKKGCYVGQEVTARMKHKTELKKGFVTVDVIGATPVGTAVMAGEKQVGTLYTQAGGQGIAYLRFDRATGSMTAGDAQVAWSSKAVDKL